MIYEKEYMQFTIKIWSKVRLNSGGPEMTVTSCTMDAQNNEFVTCKWKDNGGELNMGDFPVECLDVII